MASKKCGLTTCHNAVGVGKGEYCHLHAYSSTRSATRSAPTQHRTSFTAAIPIPAAARPVATFSGHTLRAAEVQTRMDQVFQEAVVRRADLDDIEYGGWLTGTAYAYSVTSGLGESNAFTNRQAIRSLNSGEKPELIGVDLTENVVARVCTALSSRALDLLDQSETAGDDDYKRRLAAEAQALRYAQTKLGADLMASL